MTAEYPAADAPALLKLAREDAGLTQRALAERAGLTEDAVAAIEAGVASDDRSALHSLFGAAGLRPPVPLGFYAERLRGIAERLGFAGVAVFGSAASGRDGPSSDVDLIVTAPRGATLFDLGALQDAASGLLGFPVDILLDGDTGAVADRARREAVPL